MFGCLFPSYIRSFLLLTFLILFFERQGKCQEVAGEKLDHEKHGIIDETEQIYGIAEKDASFPGGYNAWLHFIKENFVYPKNSNPSGHKIFVEFVIEKNGTLNHIKTKSAKGEHPLEEELLRVMKLSPDWNPGLIDGKPVRLKKTIPVNL